MVDSSADSKSAEPAAPDAVGRGVLGYDAAAPAVLFVLAGHSLGSTPVGGEGSPQWLDLRRLLSLDAVGEAADSKLPVEAVFDGGPTLQALWPEPFCDQVTDRLRELLDSGQMIPEGSTAPTASVPDARASTGTQQQSTGSDSALWAAATDDRPLPGDGPPLPRAEGTDSRGELTLEDVVYHGGYPGENKRRKKCVAVLSGAELSVSGPNGPDFTLAWETVHSIEVQNSDEAKFRLGVKAKRNSSVIVFECDQGVSIVLEAQEVPTMPLKGALHELLDGGSVTLA